MQLIYWSVDSIPALLWHHNEEETPWISLENLITTSLTKKPGGKHCRSYTHERLNKIVNEAALDKKKFIQHISLLCIYGLKTFKISKFLKSLQMAVATDSFWSSNNICTYFK